METFRLNFEIKESSVKFIHGDQLLFLGSCFSDEISVKAKLSGLNAYSNPFGTIFHPLMLADFISGSLVSNDFERIVKRNDVFLSWDASSTIYDLKEDHLLEKIHGIRTDFLNRIKNTKFLFITFGTAWGYYLNDNHKLVANCHKFPGNSFSKRLVEVEEIVSSWTECIHDIRVINPEIQLVFTVSPVRHSKDGLIENNRSKAILLDSVRQLETECKIGYFPSYEIVIDELRDYRFFDRDLVHPNSLAIDFVWNKFENSFCSDSTKALSEKVRKLKGMESHKILFPDSDDAKSHLEKCKELRTQIIQENSKVFLD